MMKLTELCISANNAGHVSEEVDLALWKASQCGDTDAAFAAVEEGANVNKSHENVSPSVARARAPLVYCIFDQTRQP